MFGASPPAAAADCCPLHAAVAVPPQNKHRKLSWFYSLGICNLKANFDAKPIELMLGTQQARTWGLLLRVCTRGVAQEGA